MALERAPADDAGLTARGRSADPEQAPETTAVQAPARQTAPRRMRAGRPFGDPVLWLIAAAVFGAYTAISVFRYLRHDPTSWDLGIFTEYVKQYAHLRTPIVDIRGAGVNLLGDHFHPIVALIGPFFALFPSAATLLVAQAMLAALSVFPVYRAGTDLLGVGTGRAIAIAYGFSWGLQQMVNYDFHEIAFAVPLLALSLSALIRGRFRPAVAWALPLVLVKENQGFTVAAIGLILVFAYRRRWTGLALAGWGVLGSLLAIFVIIPHFNAAHVYAYWSQAGTLNPTSGHFALSGLLAGLWHQASAGLGVKLPTLVMIALPTAFLAMRSPIALIALPGLALRFVDSVPAYWGTSWHYNATVMPIVFLAAIDAMARIRARRAEAAGLAPAGPDPAGSGPVRSGPVRPGLVRSGRQAGRIGRAMEHYGAAAMLAICAALAFQFPLSALWAPATYRLGARVSAENAAMAMIPDGAKVATDLELLAPLAARTDTFWLGNYGTNPVTRYVVFDTHSTDFQPPPRNVLAFVRSLEHGAPYQQIFSRDGVYVFRLPGSFHSG